jgi:hypothetical protein
MTTWLQRIVYLGRPDTGSWIEIDDVEWFRRRKGRLKTLNRIIYQNELVYLRFAEEALS